MKTLTTPQTASTVSSRIACTTLLALSLLLAACSSGGMEVAPGVENDAEAEIADAPHVAESVLTTRCSGDEIRICREYLPIHNGVRQCLVGYQMCEEGVWGPCIEGVPEDEDAP